jgi:NADH-quinone oxidoreductase subunit G
LFLSGTLIRALGSQNVDYRLRDAEFGAHEGVRYLGASIASLSALQRVLVVGSNLRKDHPLFAQRIRQAARKGCAVSVINASAQDWAMPVANSLLCDASSWAQALADVAAVVAAAKGIAAPVKGSTNPVANAIAQSLLSGERKAILLGNAAAHHAKASSLLALTNWIGAQTGATVGYLTEAANTVGAQLAGVLPGEGGLNAGQMLAGGLKAVLLLNNEPEFDSAAGAAAKSGLSQAQMVVTLSPFKANMVQPLGDTRPAWKVLRVLGNMLGLPGFDFESSQEVLQQISGLPAAGESQVSAKLLDNATHAAVDLTPAGTAPVVAGIYALDGLLRRAASLQATADAKRTNMAQEVSA